MKYTNDELLAFAVDIAKQAGQIMQSYFLGVDQEVQIKTDRTQVTVADKKINTLLINHVRKTFPEHGILGEEEQWHPERSELWVCDPIDGTSAFILGVPTAMFAAAFVVDGTPQVATIYDPFMDRMITAIKGKGAFLNGRRISVSAQDILENSMIGVVGSVHNIINASDFFGGLMAKGVKLKSIHGSVFQGMLVATGKEDGYLFPGRSAHDVVTTKLIVEEAGGKVTDLRGSDQPYNAPIYGAIVSNGRLHDALVSELRAYGPENFVGQNA